MRQRNGSKSRMKTGKRKITPFFAAKSFLAFYRRLGVFFPDNFLSYYYRAVPETFKVDVYVTNVSHSLIIVFVLI